MSNGHSQQAIAATAPTDEQLADMDGDTYQIECDNCDGTGRVVVELDDLPTGGIAPWYMTDCPVCGGTGQVDAADAMPATYNETVARLNEHARQDLLAQARAWGAAVAARRG